MRSVTRLRLVAATGGALILPTALHAQAAASSPSASVESNTAPTNAPTVPSASALPSDSSSKLEQLEAQVKALQQELQVVKASVAAVTPSWRGAPLYQDQDAGFSFKPKGLMQFDAGYVGFPRGQQLNGTVGGLNYNNLGFGLRARRLVLGAEGSLPGGFSYNLEVNFAQAIVDYEDIVLNYAPKNSPLRVTIGNFYPMSSLETMTGSRVTSFLERAAFTDAFNYNRRLGASVGIVDPKNDRYTLTAGLFGQPINDATFSRTGWEAAVRGTFAPKVGDATIHLGASYHHRVNNRDAQGQQYRARPLTQITDQRFIDTGTIASDGDDIAGLEAGAVWHSLHLAAEAQRLWVRGYRPTDTLTSPNNLIVGTRFNGDPSFTGGYVEAGYFLTGESRAYKNGRWDRTKVLHPFSKGGWGALQLNGRVEFVDLADRVSGTSALAPGFVNGGKQTSYQLSLIWIPMDYVRFLAQYGHLNITGGPRAVAPLFATIDTTPIDRRHYGVDTAGFRAQLDF